MAKEILDKGMARVGPLAPSQTWEDWMVELACTTRRAPMARRDGARVVAGAYLLHTNAITPVVEQSLEILEQVGFERLFALGATMTLIRYATGIALDEQASPWRATPKASVAEQLAALPLPNIDPVRWPRTADAMRRVTDGKLRDRERLFRLGALLIVRGLAESIHR